MAIIRTGDCVEVRMLRDFEVERQECLRVMRTREYSAGEHARASGRLKEIESSVATLRKNMAAPGTVNAYGGYGHDELAMFGEQQEHFKKHANKRE